jgi:hypothetical protein
MASIAIMAGEGTCTEAAILHLPAWQFNIVNDIAVSIKPAARKVFSFINTLLTLIAKERSRPRGNQQFRFQSKGLGNAQER